MSTSIGVALLSSLRKTGSVKAFGEIPDSYFMDDDERNAFAWLKGHVGSHGTFPTPGLFKEVTGIQTVMTTQSLSYYIDKARCRIIYNSAMPLYGNMQDAMRAQKPDEVVAIAKRISSLETQFNPKATGHVTLTSAVELAKQDYIDARMTSGLLRGIPSGWPYVDEQTNGWLNGELITFVGRPGRGKTYLLLYQAYNAWRAGYKVLFVSMELAALQLARRLIGIHSKINPDFIRKGRISNYVHDQLIDSMSAMQGGIPFDIIVGGFNKSVETVQAFAQETQPDIIFVDASYLLHAEKRRGQNGRRENAADTIEGLKQFCLDINRPIVQSMQFNRAAVKPRKDEDQQERQNPLAHLSLEKIGETDTVGQASSYVFGTDYYDHPFAKTRRWLGFLKGREGEDGVFAINYTFQPVDFSVNHIGYGNHADAAAAAQAAAGIDLGHMLDVEV